MSTVISSDDNKQLEKNKSKIEPWIILISVMVCAVLESLDTTISNVAIPSIKGAFAVSDSLVSWVSSGYIIASAMFMPIVGSFIDKVGQKKLLYICVTGFGITSFLCGVTNHFYILVFLRILQGAFGAPLIPISQYIVTCNFDEKDFNKAFAVWGAGIVISPVFGPLLGGYIISLSSWHWVFFINIPICILSLILTSIFVKESTLIENNIDWKGLFLIITSIGLFEISLNRGAHLHWFHSRLIIYCLLFSLIFLVIFLFHGYKNKDNIIDFRIFRYVNFTITNIILFGFFAVLMGVNILIPIFLQDLQGYTALDSGFTTLPLALAATLCFGITSVLVKKVSAKYIIIFGLCVSLYFTFQLSFLSPQASQEWFEKMYMYRGIGFGICFVPAMILALNNLPHRYESLASGLLNFSRNLGASVGISLTSSSITSIVQKNWNNMISYASHFHVGLEFWKWRQEIFPPLAIKEPTLASILSGNILYQSNVKAFGAVIQYTSFTFIIVIVIACFLQNKKIKKIQMH